jgi:hypothetical protein
LHRLTCRTPVNESEESAVAVVIDMFFRSGEQVSSVNTQDVTEQHTSGSSLVDS